MQTTDVFIYFYFHFIAQKDVETFMKAAGITVDNAEISVFFKALGENNAVDLIKNGKEKLIVMPCGGGGGGGGAAGPAAAAVVEEVKKEEEEAVDMGGLFGDDDEY